MCRAMNRSFTNVLFGAFGQVTAAAAQTEQRTVKSATISSLFSSTKPIATAARPAYEFSSEITVGMSAPPIGITSITPNSAERPTIA